MIEPDAYFRHIGYAGPHTPTLGALLGAPLRLVPRLVPRTPGGTERDPPGLDASPQPAVNSPTQTRRIETASELARVPDQVFDVAPPVSAAKLFERIPEGLDAAHLLAAA